MKAIVQERFGAPSEVLKLGQVERPKVGPEDVLVRVRASSANPWDWHFIRAEPYFIRLGPAGFRRPSFPVPGGDVAGVVEEVGSAVSGFHAGDEVYGFGHGAFAEFVAVPHQKLALKPASLTFEQSAAVPLAALTALQGLRDVAKVSAGQKVLIIGASGGVGTFAIQIAKALGAEVTGVCSTSNMALVRELGAVRVIDYTTTDFTKDVERFDVAFQLGGTASGRAIRKVLTPKGTLVLSAGDGNRWVGPLATMLVGMLGGKFGSQSVKILATDETTADLQVLTTMIEEGSVRPVIASSYPLEQAGEAVRLVEEGSPGGKVVVTL
jgi:NADPH:quinone reductase-like Zn-dependent oxidoreductase